MANNPLLEALGKQDKKPGIWGSIKKAATGTLGNVLNTLSAPQQAIFKPARGIRRTLQGEGFDETIKGIGGGLGEAVQFAAGATLPGTGAFKNLGGPDINFTETIGAKKLPFGLETLGTFATDPLTYLTLGTGSAAKGAVKTAGEAGLKALTDDIARQGLKATLKAAPEAEDALRTAFTVQARAAGKEEGSKALAKTVERSMSALKRAQGGIGFRASVPGTQGRLGFHATAVKGETVRSIGEATKLAPLGRGIKASGPGKAVRHAIIPGARAADDPDVGLTAFGKFRDSLGNRSARQARMVDDAKAEWAAGVRAVNEVAPNKYNVADDALIGRALAEGEEARAALIAARPHLEPLVAAADRIRKNLGEEQFLNGVLGFDTTAAKAAASTRVARAGALAEGAEDVQKTLATQAKAASKNADEARKATEQLRAKRNDIRRLIPKKQAAATEAVAKVGAESDRLKGAAFKSALADEVAKAKEAIEQGYPPTGLTVGHNLPADPMLVRNATARAEQAVLDSPRLKSLTEAAAKAQAAHTDLVTQADQLKGIVRESGKLATGARKGSQILERQAARKGTQAAKGRALLRSANETLEKIPAGRSGMRDPETYLRRLPEPRAAKILKLDEETVSRLGQQVRGVGSAEQAANQARRIAGGYSPAEVNGMIEAIRTGSTQGLIPELLDDKAFMDIARKLVAASPDEPIKLFQEGAGLPLLARQAEGAKAIATRQLTDDLQTIKGASDKNIFMSEDAWKEALAADSSLAKYKEVSVPGVGKFRVPAGLEADVKGALRLMGHDESTLGFDKALQSWGQVWKTYATAMLPGGIPFAARNFRSNFYLGMLDGISPTDAVYKKSFEIMTQARKITKGKKFAEEIARDGLDPVLKRELGDEAFQLFDEAKKRGVLNKTFFDVDFKDPALSAKNLGIEGAKGPKQPLKFLSPSGKLAQRGRGLNEAVENHARFSNFIKNVDRTGSFEQAANRTKTVLFDYTDLTPLEQARLKNVVPFYTFMRKNIPQQYKTALSDPIRVKLPETISEAMTEPVDEDAPDYQRRGGSRVLNESLQKFLPSGLRGKVSTPDRPFHAAVDVLDPLMSLANIPFGKEGGAPEGWQSFMRQALEPVGGPAPGIMKFFQEEGAKKSAFTGGQLPEDSDAKARRAFDAMFPGVGRALRLSGSTNANLGGSEQARGSDMSAAEIMRFLAGIRADAAGAGTSKGTNPLLGGTKKNTNPLLGGKSSKKKNPLLGK